MVKVLILAIVVLLLFDLTCAGCYNDDLICQANKMATESTNEIAMTTRMYNKTKEEINKLAKLKYSLEKQLRTQNSKVLGNALCAAVDSHDLKHVVQSHLYMFSQNYEQQLIDNILGDALAELYGCKSTSQWEDLFDSLSQNNDLKTFELLLQSKVHFIQMQNASNFQPKFFLNLYKMRQAKLYQLVRGSLKQDVEHMLRKMPTTLQYLLVYPHFCLMNSKYSEYIYTALGQKNLDSTSRYVWLWHERLSIDDSGHIKANVFESSAGQRSDLAVQLKGTKFNIFYYMMPQTNLVAAWDLSSEPLNSIWNIDFVDNERVVLYQDDYIMCSTDERYNSERRVVRGYKRGTYTTKSSECQWLLGKCDRRT